MVAYLMYPDATLITGVEDDPGGIGIRVYVGARWQGDYYLVSAPEPVEAIRRAWAGGNGGHVVSRHKELAGVGIRLSDGS